MKSIACCVALTALVMFASALPVRADAWSAKRLPPFLAGADISLLTLEEQHGTVYREPNGEPRPLIEMMKEHGYNCARLRLWVHPSGQGIFVDNLPYTISLGRRIKKAGLVLILDLHYSDSWADPGKQTKPAAWANLPFDRLTATVRRYTASVVAAMRKGGASPDIVQIGNEITGGMLWPDGKDWGFGHDFVHLGVLIKAAEAGVRDGAAPQSPPLIMIHIDRGGDWGGTKWFFDNLDAQKVPYDIIGESYYPMFHGPLSDLKTTVDNAAVRYGKPIVVEETGYPYAAAPNAPAQPKPPGVFDYPLTPQGQAACLTAIVGTVMAAPGKLGRGVVYWEPEWIPMRGVAGSWNDQTLFDSSGKALPGFDAIPEAAGTVPAK